MSELFNGVDNKNDEFVLVGLVLGIMGHFLYSVCKLSSSCESIGANVKNEMRIVSLPH